MAMVRRAQTNTVSTPPTLPPQQATPLLRRQIERMDDLQRLRYNDPKIDAWQSTTLAILEAAFGCPNGEDHSNTTQFKLSGFGSYSYVGMPEQEHQDDYRRSLNERKPLLDAFIEQLNDLAPPAARAAPDQYGFHPEIESVSGQLFRDGHYNQAALAAYIRVIEEVKRKSGIADDGDSLMNRAFGCDKQTPVIQFNTLQTDAERDEQRGLMFLFKGIVGLRNSKAHSNTLFNDPHRAHEYLALASLLLRLLEIAKVNSAP